MRHLSGQCNDTPLNCAINVPIKLRATTECGQVLTVVARRCVTAVHSEMACLLHGKTARVVARVLHCEMTVPQSRRGSDPLPDGNGVMRGLY